MIAFMSRHLLRVIHRQLCVFRLILPLLISEIVIVKSQFLLSNFTLIRPLDVLSFVRLRITNLILFSGVKTIRQRYEFRYLNRLGSPVAAHNRRL